MILLCIMLGGKSVEDVALEACKTTDEGNITKYYKLLAEPYLKYMVGSNGWYATDAEFQEELLGWSEDRRNDIVRQCGENFKAEYQVISVEKCDQDALKRVRAELDREYGYEREKIKEAAVVNVSIKARGNMGFNSWTHTVSCVKIGGSWYVHRPGFDSI